MRCARRAWSAAVAGAAWRRALSRISLTSVLLPEPETPVTHTNPPSGNAASTELEVVRRAPLTGDRSSSRSASGASGRRSRSAPRRYAPVIDCPRCAHLVDGALGDDPPAVHAGPGPDVDDVVGRPDHVLVVLDDEHGVADVGQVAERADEPVVVALVQADRRLVEHVARADEPDPTCVARRMRWASPPESVAVGGRVTGTPARRSRGTAGGCRTSRTIGSAICCAARR
jgi:hypothetical protein